MRKSSNAILFIAAGIYLALGTVAGYTTVNAIVLLLLGIERYRSDRSRISIVVMAVSTLVLVITQLALFVIIVLISLGIYYFRVRPQEFGTSAGSHRLLLNMRLDEQSWVMHSMSIWNALGEVRMDISLAVPEDKETTIVLQGLIGDLDLIVPEDYGLQVDASVLLGQVSFQKVKENGVIHRLSWKSPNYEQYDQKLKLQLFYLVGDIRIRTV
jgi:lia operon protein LiaF